LKYMDPTGLHDWYNPYDSDIESSPSYFYQDAAQQFHNLDDPEINLEQIRSQYYQDLEISIVGSAALDSTEIDFLLRSIPGQISPLGGRAVGNGIGLSVQDQQDRSSGYSFAINWLQYSDIIWPTQGEITTVFNDPSYAYDSDGDGIPDEHPRLDIANDAGTPVYAPFSGIVSRVYDDDPKKGYGIEITNEDGLSARLIHLLNRPLWNKGDEINIGQQTGFMGNTGFSFGNHLDFMLFTGPSETARDNAVDPSLFLGAVNSGDRVSW
jgi:murein DD-endopeptidase MepM/ murein hydrolase activator NlpD